MPESARANVPSVVIYEWLLGRAGTVRRGVPELSHEYPLGGDAWTGGVGGENARKWYRCVNACESAATKARMRFSARLNGRGITCEICIGRCRGSVFGSKKRKGRRIGRSIYSTIMFPRHPVVTASVIGDAAYKKQKKERDNHIKFMRLHFSLDFQTNISR